MANETRPIQFFDHLPNRFRADELLEVTVQSVTDRTVTVAPFNSGAIELPAGIPVFVFAKDIRTTLTAAIPANRTGLTQIEVRDSAFAVALQRNDILSISSFLSRFLKTFEIVFEELQAAIEGTPGGILQLTVQSILGTTVTVTPFAGRAVEFPVGTPITVVNKPLRATLTTAIPANLTGLNQIALDDAAVVGVLQAGDVLNVHPGGLPDLFSLGTTPPAQLKHRPQEDFDYLNFLASWIALPLRAEKEVDWNRLFFKAAILLYSQRSTLPGMDALLRAWLKDDLLETNPPLLILTDLARTYIDINAVFQLAPPRGQEVTGEIYAQLGVNTVLGEGPPFFFIADLIADPSVRELRQPVTLDLFARAARFLLDAEKPAHTYYQLRVRAHTMQMAPPRGQEVRGEVYAQVGETTLLWDEPWVFDSDC